MSRTRAIALGLGALLVGTGLLVWAYPRAFPLLPAEWRLDQREAVSIALERLRDLGPPIQGGYVVPTLLTAATLERRLQLESRTRGAETLRRSQIAAGQVTWDVRVYAPQARSGEWTYRALIGLDGQVLSLRRRFDDREVSGQLDAETARQRATEYLAAQGYDPADFAETPEARREDRGNGSNVTIRFASREQVLGPTHPYGLEVRFEGESLAGFGPWHDEPEPEELRATIQQTQLLFMTRAFLFTLLLLIVAVPFLKRYHDGQLGVRRGLHFFLLTAVGGLVFLALCGAQVAEGSTLGLTSRKQSTFLISAFVFCFQVIGLAALAFTSWSVGESLCRERGWAQKLASLDALFRGRVANATVARSAIAGGGIGVFSAGATLVAAVAVQRFGAWPQSEFLFDTAASASLPVLSYPSVVAAFFLPVCLFGGFLVPVWATRRFGDVPGLLLSIVVAVVTLTPPVVVLPIQIGILAWGLAAVFVVLTFYFFDLLAALLAGVTAIELVGAMPLLTAEDRGLELHGWLVLLVAFLPLLLSLRHLLSGEELVYRYDDVPPHVRRIAERERQRVELETAARIQSSILPDLPPQLGGIEIAHSYRPASEVGGDFYDVLALDDGRLAVAVGDVAGHGVSSGLVMSMAKTALAVQVTFDPEVTSVLATLNRLVYQGARQRLLTTLCYAVADPQRSELQYASAGHLYPYRLTADGKLQPLHAASYPLGVRSRLEVPVKTARFEPGDTVFLYSDGLVEACADGSEEPFGFERLEESLRRQAGRPPAEVRDAVLAELAAHTGRRPCEDDVTVLVLRRPA